MPRSARPGGYPAADDFWSKLNAGIGRNSNALIGLGTGLLSAPSFDQGLAAGGQGFMQGAQVDSAYRVAEEEKAARAAQINQTAQYLAQTFPDLAEAVNAGMPLDAAWNEAMKRSQPGYGQAGGDERFFGNIVPMQGPDGKTVLGQVSSEGRWQPLQGADGMSPAPTTKTVDTGKEIITYDIYGNELFRTPKENYGAAYDTARGSADAKGDAETVSAAGSLASKLPGIQKVVTELSELGKKATYTMFGVGLDEMTKQLGIAPGEAAVARAKYIAMVDNQVLPLLRDTFGAAFTQKEGETLRATLGDPNKSPQEKDAVLEAFIEQKMRDLEALQSRLPGAAAPGGNVTSTGIPWSFEP
jgi:hypothetical protein